VEGLAEGDDCGEFNLLYHRRKKGVYEYERMFKVVEQQVDVGYRWIRTREGAWTAKTNFRVGCTSSAHSSAVASDAAPW
jgi:hypothetical protein